jgi:hypothetical protein
VGGKGEVTKNSQKKIPPADYRFLPIRPPGVFPLSRYYLISVLPGQQSQPIFPRYRDNKANRLIVVEMIDSTVVITGANWLK